MMDKYFKVSICFVSLTLSQTTNFLLFQIERLSRRQFGIICKMADCSPNG